MAKQAAAGTAVAESFPSGFRQRQAPCQCETPAEPAHLLVQHLELPAHKGVVVGVDVGGDEAAGRKKGGEKEEKTAAQA